MRILITLSQNIRLFARYVARRYRVITAKRIEKLTVTSTTVIILEFCER